VDPPRGDDRATEAWASDRGLSKLERFLADAAEPAPGRIQLLADPRQVGKTSLLLELAERA
jgi:predicted AAA+ superfamily ATPase